MILRKDEYQTEATVQPSERSFLDLSSQTPFGEAVESLQGFWEVVPPEAEPEVVTGVPTLEGNTSP